MVRSAQQAYTILGGDTMLKRIHINIFPEHDGSFFAEPSEWMGCYALGATLEEVKENMADALALHLGTEPDSFELTFEMCTHELRDVPVEDDIALEHFDSVEDWLTAMGTKKYSSVTEMVEDIMNEV